MARWRTVLLAGLLIGALVPLAGTNVTAGGSTCEGLLDGLQNDGGSGSDASDVPEDPTWVPRHTDLGGFLLPIAIDGFYEDAVDAYAFDGDDTGSILINVTALPGLELEVTLLSPDGQPMGVPPHGDGPLAALGPGAGVLGTTYQLQVADRPGTWTLVITLEPLRVEPGELQCEQLYARLAGGGGDDYEFDIGGCEPWCEQAN